MDRPELDATEPVAGGEQIPYDDAVIDAVQRLLERGKATVDSDGYLTLIQPTTPERANALEEAARVADEMRLKHASPTGDAYSCGAWDQGVRIAQRIRALSASPPEVTNE